MVELTDKEKRKQLLEEYRSSKKESLPEQGTIPQSQTIVQPELSDKEKRKKLLEDFRNEKSTSTYLSDTIPQKRIVDDDDFINNLESVDPPEVSNAIGYAFKLGLLDTWRGGKQILGFSEEEMRAEQKKLRQLMEGENGGWVTAAYFGGAILDPAGWLIPFGKAKTLFQMGKYGMVSGGIAGALGYVDKDTGATRGSQIALGAAGGAVVSPALGALRNLGVKVTGKGKVTPLFRRKNVSNAEAIDKGLHKVKVEGDLEEEILEKGKIYTTGPEEIAVRTEKQMRETAEEKSIFDSLVGIFKKQKVVPFPFTKVEPDAPKRGELLKKPQWFLKRLTDGYEKNIGRRALKVISTGEGGTAFAGGLIGFNADPESPVFDIDSPLSSRLGRAFVGASGGYLGISFAKKKKITRVLGKAEGEPVEVEETLTDFLGRALIDKYGLTKDYKKLLMKYDGTRNDIATQFVRIAKQMEKLTPNERKVLYNMLEGDIREEVPNEVLNTLTAQARDKITEVSQMYKDLGLIGEETFRRNKDRYLGRLYKKGEEPIELKKIGDDLKPRGIIEEVTVGDYLKTYSKAVPTLDDVEVIPHHRGWEIFEGDHEIINGALHKVLKRATSKQELVTDRKVLEKLYADGKINYSEFKDGLRAIRQGIESPVEVKGRVIESKKLSNTDKINIRWELTKSQRKARGEIEDAAIAMEYTGMIMANTVAKYQFFADVASQFALKKTDIEGKTAKELLEKGYIKMPESVIAGTKKKKYGSLSGKYVPEAVYKDLVAGNRYQKENSSFFYNKYKKLNSLWKVSKTAWNPTVHVNNIFGNIILSDLADIPISTLPKALKILYTHNSDNATRSDIVMRAIKYGVFDADFVGKEIKNFKLEELEKIYKTKATDEWNASVDFATNIYKSLSKEVKSITGKLEDWYRIEDHVFRLNAFMHRIRMGDTDAEAALIARKQFIDYDINAPVINAMRNTVTPFLSFTYRLVPLLAESAVLRPHKYFKYIALGYGLNKLGEMYGDEEQIKKERALLPDYEAGNIMDLPFMPKKLIRLPVKTEDNTSKYINISRLFPGGDVLSFEGNNAIPFLPEPLQISGGVAGDFITSMIGYDLFRMQAEPGRHQGGSALDETVLGVKSFSKKLIPNFPFLPGSYSTIKLDRALKGDISPYREQESELFALANAFGIKLSTKSVKTLGYAKKKEYERFLRQKKSLGKMLKNDLRSKKITRAEYDEKYGKLIDEIKNETRKVKGMFKGIDPYAMTFDFDITDIE